MRDIDPRIFRPVSFPEFFVGAPVVPAAISFCANMFLFLFSAVFDMPFPVFFIFTMILCHVSLIAMGKREPHISTLITSFRLSNRKTNNIGPKRSHDFAP